MDAATLIKKFEGVALKAYHGAADKPGVYTVGYGATGPDITADTVWTLAQAEHDLAERVAVLQQDLAALIEVPLTDNQLAALTSLVYNIGLHNFETSPLLQHLNAGSYDVAAGDFLSWRKSNGNVVPGLESRRREERLIFRTP